MRQINDLGLWIIKDFEGCKLVVYKDIKGLPTVGWGHKVLVTDKLSIGDTITQEQADCWLIKDVNRTAGMLDSMIHNNITENQFSACVSLAYNIGVGAFERSTLLAYINNNQLMMAGEEILRWDHSKGLENFGLLRRRKAEQSLFNT